MAECKTHSVPDKQGLRGLPVPAISDVTPTRSHGPRNPDRRRRPAMIQIGALSDLEEIHHAPRWIEPNTDRGRPDTTETASRLLDPAWTGGGPYELEPLIAALINEGLAVSTPVLPGHDGPGPKMPASDWRDWVRAADAAFVELAARQNPVAVIGFSTGATLALTHGRKASRRSAGADCPVSGHSLCRADPLAARVLPSPDCQGLARPAATAASGTRSRDEATSRPGGSISDLQSSRRRDRPGTDRSSNRSCRRSQLPRSSSRAGSTPSLNPRTQNGCAEISAHPRRSLISLAHSDHLVALDRDETSGHTGNHRFSCQAW